MDTPKGRFIGNAPPIFPKSMSEMLGFSFRRLPRGTRFEGTPMYGGAGSWRCRNSRGGSYGGEAWSEGAVSMVRYGGAGDAETASEYTEERWGQRCRNSMGGHYGGGARSEGTLRYGGADAEIA